MKSKIQLVILCLTALSLSNYCFTAVANQYAWHKWDQDNNFHEIGFMPVINIVTADGKLSSINTNFSPDVLIKRNVDQSKNIVRQVVTDSSEFTRYSGFIPEVDGTLLMDMAYVMYDGDYNASNCVFTAKIKFFRENTEADTEYSSATGKFKRIAYRLAKPHSSQENKTFGSGSPADWVNTILIDYLTTDNSACFPPPA